VFVVFPRRSHIFVLSYGWFWAIDSSAPEDCWWIWKRTMPLWFCSNFQTWSVLVLQNRFGFGAGDGLQMVLVIVFKIACCRLLVWCLDARRFLLFCSLLVVLWHFYLFFLLGRTVMVI
jgi:hypothetical protein